MGLPNPCRSVFGTNLPHLLHQPSGQQRSKPLIITQITMATQGIATFSGPRAVSIGDGDFGKGGGHGIATLLKALGLA